MIKGGYILQPRIIQESDISVSPPCIREIWNYLLREANSQDKKYNGYSLKRGQLFRTYEEIREGTKWYIGWRKVTYTEDQTKKSMAWLRKTGRITTTKAPGGVLITICKYDYYQDPKNYESTKESTNEGTIAAPMPHQPGTTYNKNDKNNKNDNNKEEEPETSVSAPIMDFVDKVIGEFARIYEFSNAVPYRIVNKGKERSAAGKLLREFKKIHPDYNTEQTLTSLTIYFERVVTINDAWLRANMSMPTLISKFNEINNILRNGKSASNKGGTDREFFNTIAKNLSGK